MGNLSEKELFLRLGIGKIGFLSTYQKKVLENKLDNISELALLSREDLIEITGYKGKGQVPDFKLLPEMVKRDVAIIRAYSMGVLFTEDDLYPLLLSQIYDPPYLLFYRGNPEILSIPSVAIVGTRRPTGEGMRVSREFGSVLSAKGYSVVSGLALGIDTHAHSGVLEQGSSLTTAVLGSGLDTLYPARNRQIGKRILERGGCICGEYYPGDTAQKWHFPQRNRIISALSVATVVIEAPAGSGALITADFALEHNRDVYFHHLALEYEQKTGKKIQSDRNVFQYVEDGATVVNTPEQLIEYLEDGSVKPDYNVTTGIEYGRKENNNRENKTKTSNSGYCRVSCKGKNN